MNYYIAEFNSGEKHTAGVKARDDIYAILSENGYIEIAIESNEYKRRNRSLIHRIALHIRIMNIWMQQIKKLKADDVLIVQFPIREHSVLLFNVFKKLKKHKVKVVLLVHDLEIFRNSKKKDAALMSKVRMYFEEKSLLLSASSVIVHNNKMHEVLRRYGIEDHKIINLEIFDYLIAGDNQKNKECEKNDAVVIAGNLNFDKAPYVYQLPEQCEFRLYGPNFDLNLNKNHCSVEYMGAFDPDILTEKLQGSFGLVWDGESIDTCDGIYGEYLRINNPHKTSLYLASGIPVIIWKDAALAEFVTENQCGITISSLNDIEGKINALSDYKYKDLRDNACAIGERLRKGKYTMDALAKVHSVESRI